MAGRRVNNGATLGFEETLWQAADKMREGQCSAWQARSVRRRTSSVGAVLMLVILALSGCGSRSDQSENEIVTAATASQPAAAEITASSVVPLITIVERVLDVRPGQNARLRLKVEPTALCFIAVEYSTRISEASDLTPKRANDQGIVEWEWKVGSRTRPGEWPVTIVCIIDERGVVQTLNLVVREAPMEENPDARAEDAEDSGS